MRADRLLSLVLLLRHRGLMTAAALADELEVSTRTVLRDVEALSSAGIPVYAERGRHGGFALLPGFTTDLTGLTPDEAVALLTSPGRATSDALGMGAAFSSAIRKVVAALPETSRAKADAAAGRVLVRRGGWLRDPAAPDPRLAAVQRAVLAGTRLRIHYAGGSRPGDPPPAPRWRTVDPVGLVEAAGQWYLLGLDGGQDRTYRMSRVEDVEELPQPAARPEGVDLDALWARRRDDFRARISGLEASVRVPDHLVGELAKAAVSTVDARADGGGRTVVRVLFGGVGHAERVVWAMAPEAEALGPPELREAVRARAAGVAEQHA
ncbi:helix-turn-helix transcriptional regulator [Pseudonocardia humida]|uniref:WYL domain-containing protein n=1 Tax=Pseudonocardia humida TaxID=2800819 RepID=A0ABT0ZWD1_9PSEU|nr:WYL domain-containing protein [Pseudonocardia humida]MCO1655052.1 WYL domain-containing protein [Pseudonocardia humida]